MTPVPRSRGELQDLILTILRQHDRPRTAYSLLDQMRQDDLQLAPTSVYRALDALTKRGAIHRVESLKAYMACRRSNHDHAYFMAICDACGMVEERIVTTIIDDITAEAIRTGFEPTSHLIELRGRCADCGSEGAKS